MNKLPLDVLAKIWDHVAFDNAMRCPRCERIFCWEVDARPATTIRSVCRRWRDGFFRKVIMPGVLRRGGPRWCVRPQHCIQLYYDFVRDRVRRTRPLFFYAELHQNQVIYDNFIGAPEETTSSEEDYSQTEGTSSAEEGK